MALYIISAWIGKERGSPTGVTQYWNGAEFSRNYGDAAVYGSLPIAEKMAKIVANKWQMIVGVGSIANPFADKPLNIKADTDRRKAKVERRRSKRKTHERRSNPVPLSSAASLKESRKRFKDFRGDTPGSIRPVKVNVPKSAMTVGELAGVLYNTVRDGKREDYIHKFRKKSRPLLAASDDGSSLHIIGGRYEFTERGIVDK